MHPAQHLGKLAFHFAAPRPFATRQRLFVPLIPPGLHSYWLRRLRQSDQHWRR